MPNFNLKYNNDNISIDANINQYIAKLELLNEPCHLKHAPEYMNIKIPLAVDYLCQYLGFNKSHNTTESIRIPICKECLKGLYDKNWVLVYCITCNSSQWIWKPNTFIEFNTDVIWLDKCPKCKEEK